jgi:hypothetical protein
MGMVFFLLSRVQNAPEIFFVGRGDPTAGLVWLCGTHMNSIVLLVEDFMVRGQQTVGRLLGYSFLSSSVFRIEGEGESNIITAKCWL